MLDDESMWKKWAGRAQKVSGDQGGWAPMPVPPEIKVVEAGSKPDGVIWRYTTDRPADGWIKPGFNDSRWKQGPGGFGTEGTPGSVVRTRWDTPDIYIRREITIPAGADLPSLQLYVHHDEDAKIYLNGVLAAQTSGFTADYEVIEMLPAARAALKPGTNLLAVQCHQTSGGQYIDVGLAVLKD
jgi:hypothetical protein